MPSFFTKVALGAEWSGEGLNLVALGRRFRQYVALGVLQVADPRGPEAGKQVAEFLNRHRLRESAVTACLPRDSVLVRFLELPAEAEPQLKKVIGYQISSLHPFEDDQVLWDCAVVEKDVKGGRIRVMVVLAERMQVETYCQVLSALGIRLKSLSVAAAVLTSVAALALPDTALVVCGRRNGVELVGFHQGKLAATREVSAEPPEDLTERFERELHSLRSALRISDPAALPVFVCGLVPEVFSELMPEAAAFPRPKLTLNLPPNFDLAEHLPGLAAAYVSLERKPHFAINLLPLEQRQLPEVRLRVPLGTLGSTAALIWLVALSHGWIEKQMYGRALERQIQYFASSAARVRNDEQRVAALDSRAALLEGVREETWKKLRVFQELTHLLPNGTWVSELQISEGTVELSGTSDHAAALVGPLENSPYFTQVEFTSPITRDSRNKEYFRMRIRLRQPAHP